MFFYVISFVYLKTDELLMYIVFLGDSIKMFPSEISVNIQFIDVYKNSYRVT